MAGVYRPIHDDDLQEALSLHKQWLASQGCAGRQARFVGKDLSNRDLSGHDLTKTDFSGARIETTDLSYSNLTGTVFTGALLRDVNLSWSNLTDAVGLDTGQLGRCDLTGCKLPEHLKDCGELESVESVSEIAQRHFAGIVAVCAYCILTIATTRDFRLFNNTGSVQLPVVRVSLPTELFFWLAPAALISYFVYFHICLQRLWEAIVALPARFVDGATVYQRTNRWMLNGMVRLCLRKPDEPRYALIKSQIAASVGLAYWLVPVTVALLAIRYFPRQDPWISSLHCMLFGLACGTAFYFEILALATLKQRPARVGSHWAVLMGAGAALLLFITSVPRLTAEWRTSLVHVNLREAKSRQDRGIGMR